MNFRRINPHSVVGPLLVCWGLLMMTQGVVWAADKKPSSNKTASAKLPAASSEAELDDSQATLTRRNALIASLTIFVLAIFIGFEVVTKVPPTLHTPLMSGSNAISGITVVGALLAAGFGQNMSVVAAIGMLAVTLATVNVVGGFLVTHRMLAMFIRKR